MNNNKNTFSITLDFPEALLLLFIAFKLAGIIDWSWVWILAPVWITLIVVAVAGLVFLIVQHRSDSRWRRTKY